MTDPQWPHRLRLHGGRNTHAARPINGDRNNLVTACGYMAGPRDDSTIADNATVNCRNCAREVTR